MTQKQSTLALLGGALLVAGGLLAAVYQSNRAEEQKKAAEESASKLFTLDPAAVTSLKVTAKGQTAELARVGEAWVLTAPVRAPADPAAVQGVLSRLSTLKKKQTVEEKPADLARYGLAQPEAHLVASWAGGSADLTLGAQNEFNSTQYARVGGSEAVLLVEGGNGWTLEKTPFDLRDKHVAVFDEKGVQSVSVRGPQGSYQLERSGMAWRMTAPQAMRADAMAVGNLLSALRNLSSLGIADESGADPGKYGLASPATEVVLGLPEGKLTVGFGAPEGATDKLYAKASAGPTVYQVPTNATEPLKQTPASLEDKTVLHFATEDVAALSFTTPSGATVLLQRKHTPASDAGPARESWTQLSPRPGEGKLWKVSGIMHNLSSLRATKVEAAAPTDLKAYGLDAPRKKVTVEGARGEALAELWVGSEAGGNLYVKSPSDPRVFQVEKAKLADLPEGPDDLLVAPPADGGAPTGP